MNEAGLPFRPTASLHEAIVIEAREWLGTPFHWEAAKKGVGCDCRGLIAGVARELGRPEAEAIEAQLTGYSRRIDEALLAEGLGRLFERVRNMEPGDILLLAVGPRRQPVHLAIYAGAGRMIHCYSRGPMRVIETGMGQVWREAVVSIWRWKDLPDG